MTAEILIMNQNAVVMAADSAATISGSGSQKVRNHAIKLFSLSKYAPVGVMIYNQASLLMYPWETLIKEYRRQLDRETFDTIEGYRDDFIKWMNGCDFIKDNDLQNNYFMDTAYQRISDIFVEAFNRAIRSDEDNKNPNDFVYDTVCEFVSKLEIKEYCDLFNIDDENRLIEQYRDIVYEILHKITQEQKYPENLDEYIKEKILRYLILLLTRNEFQNFYTGIVISGYVDKAMHPSYAHFKMGRIFDNKIRIKIEESEVINVNKQIVVEPFAQTDVVDTITKGIAPDVMESLYGVITKSHLEIAVYILQYFKERDLTINRELIDDIVNVANKAVSDSVRMIERVGDNNHYMEFKGSLVLAQKEELASIAETLVELTSFKRRVSTEDETVGGPVDVMVITKGDGLIWVKRKHYFDDRLNHHCQ